MARTTFSGPVVSTAGFETGPGGVTKLASYTVATLPPAASNTAGIVYVSNAASTPCVAYSNGTNWLRCDTAAIVT